MRVLDSLGNRDTELDSKSINRYGGTSSPVQTSFGGDGYLGKSVRRRAEKAHRCAALSITEILLFPSANLVKHKLVKSTPQCCIKLKKRVRGPYL